MSEVPPQPETHSDSAIDDRVRPLAHLFASSDLIKLRVRDDQGELVLRGNAHLRASAASESGPAAAAGNPSGAAGKLAVVSADLVGIMHFARPAPLEGALLSDDHELGYVEALGIRNPVRSLGAGRIVAINVSEGQPVDFGQALFTIDRNI